MRKMAQDYADGKTDLSHVRKSKRARIIRMAEALTAPALTRKSEHMDYVGAELPDEVHEALIALEGTEYQLEDIDDELMEESGEDLTDPTLD